MFDMTADADGQTVAIEPDLLVEFTVPGTPQQRGSKRAALIPKKEGGWITDKNGRPIVAARDDNEKSKGFLQLAKIVAANAWGEQPLHQGPVALAIEFRFARLKGHYGSRKGVRYVKDSAPRFVATTPDLDKLVRTICDSLSTTILADDKQVAVLRDIAKVYTDGPACAVVRVFRLK